MSARDELLATRERRDPQWPLDETPAGANCRRPASSLRLFLFDGTTEANPAHECPAEDRCDLKEVLGAIRQQWRDARRDSLDFAGRRHPFDVSG